jgi:hypothetical protein
MHGIPGRETKDRRVTNNHNFITTKKPQLERSNSLVVNSPQKLGKQEN